MSQIRLSSGERVNVKETIEEIRLKISKSEHDEYFIKLTSFVWVSSLGEHENEFLKEDPIIINVKHIVSFY